MISLHEQMKDRDAVLKIVTDIELAASSLDSVTRGDTNETTLHAKNVALFVKKNCEKIRQVYETRERLFDEELNKMAKEYEGKLRR